MDEPHSPGVGGLAASPPAPTPKPLLTSAQQIPLPPRPETRRHGLGPPPPPPAPRAPRVNFLSLPLSVRGSDSRPVCRALVWQPPPTLAPGVQVPQGGAGPALRPPARSARDSGLVPLLEGVAASTAGWAPQAISDLLVFLLFLILFGQLFLLV